MEHLTSMPIEFRCTSCQSLVRTPDGSEGKTAHCPQCQGLVVVPSAASLPAPLGGVPHFSDPQQTPQQGINPFADRPAAGNVQSLNPYAAPTGGMGYQSPTSAEAIRQRVMIPAIVSLIMGILGECFMILMVIGNAITTKGFSQLPPGMNDARDPAERLGFAIGFGAILIGGNLTNILQIVGAICMLRMRNHGLALTAAAVSLLPCNCYCFILTMPIAVWSLIVLWNDQVKAQFR